MRSIRLTSFSIAFVVTMFLLLLLWFLDVWSAHWVALSSVIGVVFFYLVNWILMKFIEHKIKPLYMIIDQKKIKSENTIFTLEGDIRAWAECSRTQMESLRSLENYRKEFLGNVSHELKTPLFSLQGYVDTLIAGVDDEHLQSRYLQRCDKNIERLINIVKDLEDISKLEDQSMVLYKSDFDIVSLFKEVSDGIGNLAENRDVKINIIEKRSVMVYADRERIEQVAMNLLSNAVKYNVEGGIVDVKFEDMFDKIMVQVSDTGMGIDKEYINRVFERFYRIDKARSRESGGTGLGLAIVKHIIEAHKETVNVQSAVNVGSTFFFTLAKSSSF